MIKKIYLRNFSYEIGNYKSQLQKNFNKFLQELR